MKNKPLEVLIIILLAEVLLVGYAFLYGKYEIPIVKENIRFLTLDKLMDFSVKNQNNTADSLLQNYLSNTVNDDFILKRTSLSKVGPKKQNILLTNPDVDGGKALDKFFEAVDAEKDSSIVRIAHYGDSQLEGDRMSNLVRDKFHEKFGGSGLGYVPMKDLPPVSYYRYSSENWAKYTVFHDRAGVNDYGLSGAMFRFYKYSVIQEEDKKPGDTVAPLEGLQNNGSSRFFSNATVSVNMRAKYAYNSISFLYGNSTAKCTVNFYDASNGNQIQTDTLLPCSSLCWHKTNIGNCLNVKIEFTADNSPDFLGMYFDNRKGVQVDNYAIRGHTGDGLLMIPDAQLKQMLKLTNTRLVIFQYGANVIPFVNSEKGCEWLTDLYYRLFTKFKRANPEMSILVVGAGDMAKESEGKYASYPWIPKITEAQKKAALKAGCAYFDLFSMMGGMNSILVWSKKGMAVTNGHFSEKGQRLVANEMVEALMIEYNLYQHRKRNKK